MKNIFKEYRLNKIQFLWISKILLLLILSNVILLAKDNKSITLALVGPLTTNCGLNMIKSVKLRISEINQAGGIQNRKIELLTFDDMNNKKLAIQKAKEAVNSDALIVFGHCYSSTTAEGIKVYKKENMPVISATATSTQLTKNNSYFFRTVPSNAQEVQTLAYYLKYIMKKNKVIVIYDNDMFGIDLYEKFLRVAKEIRLRVIAKYEVDSSSKNLNKNAKKIVSRIRTLNKNSAIFFATHSGQAIPIIYHLKKQNIKMPLIGSSAISEISFAKEFNRYPLEIKNKGYYTDNLYCVVPMLFDIANKKLDQFKNKLQSETINSTQATWYDTASIVIKALNAVNLNQKRDKIRNELKDKLLSMNQPHLGIEGVTGKLYFQKDGSINKKSYISKFQKQRVVSSLVQLNNITNLALKNLIKNNEYSEKKLKKEYPYLLKVNNGYLIKKNIIKVGYRLNKITNINIPKKTATLDFDIWFRSKNKINFKDIYFSNIVDKINFSTPIDTKIVNSEKYQRYKIKSKFYIDFDINKFKINQHLVGFSLGSKQDSTNELVFIADILNMNHYTGQAMVRNIEKNNILNLDKWKIRSANFYQSNLKRESLGNPTLLTIGLNEFDTPNINLYIVFDDKLFVVKNYLSSEMAIYLFIIIFFFIILLEIIKKYFLNFKILFFMLNSLSIYILLFSVEVFALDILNNYIDRDNLVLIASFINILWIYLTTFLINKFIKNIIYKKIPNLLQSMISYILYFITFIIIYRFIFYGDLTTILAIIGTFLTIIIWAVKVNLSNIFSGLSLSIHQTMAIGDWVKFSGYPEGKVVEISWNKIVIKCRNGSLLNIPSSTIANSTLTNYSKTKQLMQILHIDVKSQYSPKKVKKILLNSLKNINGILDNPAPQTEIQELFEYNITYKIVFYIDDYQKINSILQNVWTKIWKELDNEDMIKLNYKR